MKNFFNNKSFAAKKASISSWITLYEFSKFRKTAIWATREKRYHTEYKLLQSRIERLVKTNGFNFTFKYLKECLRLTTLYLAGTPVTTKADNAVGVRVNQYGLPVIIPSALRKELSLAEASRITTRTVLTLLSMFRVFPTKVKPDLSSIVEPFSGINRSLDNIKMIVVKLVGTKKVGFGSIKGFISESSGPVAKKATWGAGLDALALLSQPRVAIVVIKRLISSKAYPYIISLLVTWVIVGPFYVVFCVLGALDPLPLGRLSVVYDQAGKARIVAMANWWLQLCLKPLHDSIFRVLEGIDQDGTFNQDGPLTKLMENPSPNDKFSCFDLSSATDRLPIDLQVDILNSIGVDGFAWKSLVSIPWFYRGKEVHYSVGQPMGAYSSWAMLALTHHVIVMKAAELAGIKNFTSYALLGDDIVINNDSVADKYLLIMESLGVRINMQKSIISKEIAEFAKRLVSPTFELSPIGAGNILIVSRRTSMVGALLAELYNKKIVTDIQVVLELIKDGPKDLNFLVLWTYFGSCRHLYSARLTSTFMEVWNTYGGSQLINFSFGYHLFSGLRTTLYDDVTLKAPRSAKQEERLFWRSFYKLHSAKGKVLRLLESLTLVFSPGLYLYAVGLLRASVKADYQAREFRIGRFRPDQPEVLLDYADFGGLSVKWSKRQAKQYGQFVKQLYRNIDELTRSY